MLGFTRAEVASILFGEFMIEIMIAIPIGIALSQGIIDLIAHFHSNESFQIPGRDRRSHLCHCMRHRDRGRGRQRLYRAPAH